VSQPPQGQPPPTPPLPPQPPFYGQPYYYAPQQESSWPKVVGVISIVLAGLGLTGRLVGAFGNAIASRLRTMRWGGAMQPANLPDWWATWQIAGVLLGVLLQGLLLIAGVLLLKRQAAARALHLAYAPLAIVLAVAGMAITYPVMRSAFEQTGLQQMPAIGPAIVASVIGGMIFSLAYPVFLLVWFLRGRIADEVRSWKRAI